MTYRLAYHLGLRDWDVKVVALFEREENESIPPLLAGRLLHLHAQNWSDKLKLIWWLARIARGADLVLGGMEFAATNYGYAAAVLTGKPFISWTHIAFREHIRSAGALDRRISLGVYSRLKHIVFPSAGALNSLSQLLGGKPHGAVWSVIENTHCVETVLSASSMALNTNAFTKKVIIGVGRLVKQKAFDRLIRAHATLCARGLDHHLVILGDGPLRPALEAEVDRLGVRATVFMPGHVDNVNAWLAHADLFALCSEYEGLPLVLLEALDAGVPAVAMDCPAGPREILQNGYAGRLTPANDEAAFQTALGELLSSPKLRAQYAERGRKRVLHYRPERIIPQWEALLSEVVSHGHRGTQ